MVEQLGEIFTTATILTLAGQDLPEGPAVGWQARVLLGPEKLGRMGGAVDSINASNAAVQAAAKDLAAKMTALDQQR